MGGLLEALSTWIDRKTLGDIALARSGRLGAAVVVFLMVRIVSRTLTLWYRAVRSDLLERIERTLEDNGPSIPFPQRDLHIVSQPPAAGQ